MKKIEKLLVKLDLEGQSYEAGELVLFNGKIFFRYFSAFLQSGLNLSPIKLPFNDEVAAAEPQPFEGLFGLFNDSLPDGWGRLLLDRYLRARGLQPETLSPLDRLAFVGREGMGALQYEPENTAWASEFGATDLDALAGASLKLIKGSSTELLEDLLQMAGSSGGARPKIKIGWQPKTGVLFYGGEALREGVEPWLIKFPATTDWPDIAHIEWAYHKMALAAGLEMSPCRLFEGKSGRCYFGTQRFDRLQNRQRLHMHTASGLMHDNFALSSMDYGHLMDAAFRLEKKVAAYEKAFRLAAFNVFAHNRDDHSKNFSFLMDGKGDWRLAPAYDLTYSSSAYGLHSTTVAGESRNPGSADLLRLAAHFGLKNAATILAEVRAAVAQWDQVARDCGVDLQSRQTIQTALNRVGR